MRRAELPTGSSQQESLVLVGLGQTPSKQGCGARWLIWALGTRVVIMAPAVCDHMAPPLGPLVIHCCMEVFRRLGGT